MLIVSGENAEEVLRQVKIRIVVNQFIRVRVTVGNEPIAVVFNNGCVRFGMFCIFVGFCVFFVHVSFSLVAFLAPPCCDMAGALGFEPRSKVSHTHMLSITPCPIG